MVVFDKIIGVVCSFLLNRQFAFAGLPGQGIPFPSPIPEPTVGVLSGHLKPFGTQRAPDGPLIEYDEPLAAPEYWERHVKHHIPLVIRGGIKKSPAIKLWSDEYLKEQYGNLDILVELKKENRSVSSGRMRLESFLNIYKDEEVYVVSMLPTEMMKDIQAIPSVLCGTFKNYTHEANLWISNGGTRSVIHYDADHNFHCMIRGRKDFMMMKNTALIRKYLYFLKKDPGVGSGFSKLNPDIIDMNKYPNIAKAPWTYATLYAGDCIYIPSVYIHQVRAYERSIAATTLFTEDIYGKFDGHDCKPELMEEYHSMSEINFHWTYSKGDPVIDMGFMNHEKIKGQLKDSFTDDNVDIEGEKMYFKHFVRFAFQFPHLQVHKNLSKAEDTFKLLTGGKDHLDLKSVATLTREQLKMLIRLVESPHGIVTNGTVQIVAKPRDRHLYEDDKLDPVERKKMIEAADLDPKRHAHIYERLMGEGEDDGDDGERRMENEEDNDKDYRHKKDRRENQEDDDDEEDDDDNNENRKEGDNEEKSQGDDKEENQPKESMQEEKTSREEL